MAAGKVYQDLGCFDPAYQHFAAAHTSQPKLELRNDLPGRVPAMAGVFSREFFSRHRDLANPTERPVFVFGMPRSGTSLVEQILASHPDVHGCGELYFLHSEASRIIREFGSVATMAKQSDSWADTAKRISSNYLDLLSAYSATAKRVVDKMPHNFEILWFLALVFPHATFIHVRRNPMDTCVSCFTHPLGPFHRYANDQTTLGKYYRAYHALMEHWKGTLPVGIVDVSYEKLVSDTNGEARRLVAATGLEWSDDCIDFHSSRRSVRTLSRRQVEQPVYQNAIGAWRRYGTKFEPLRKALRELGNAGSSSDTNPVQSC